MNEYIFPDERGRIHASVVSDRARNTSVYIGMGSRLVHSHRRTVSSKVKYSGVATPTAAFLMRHIEKVDDDFHSYDVSGDKYKLETVSKVNKGIKQNMTS